jgi:hypothetical protein
MVTDQDQTTAPIPACPATSAATRRFVARRFGADLADDRFDPVLRRRERTVVDRRSAGDARGADVLGWVSLAAVLAGASASLVSHLAHYTDIDRVLAVSVADAGDGLGEIAAADAPPTDVVVSGLTVPDVGSRAGWALVGLAGRAAAGKSISVGGFPMASAVVLAKLKARILAGERFRP